MESNVELFLESIKSGGIKPGGTIIEYHHLLRRHDYPDFYVRTKTNKEYLFECKNLAQKILPDGTVWQHNLNWVNQNIMEKHWDYKQYQTRCIIGYKHRGVAIRQCITVQKSPAIPALIMSHFNFDSQAKARLYSFFKRRNIVVFGGQIGTSGPWASNLLLLLNKLSEK